MSGCSTDCWNILSLQKPRFLRRVIRKIMCSRKNHVEHFVDDGDDNCSDVFRDYEVALPFIEIPFEQEPYFRLVDRPSAEEILRNRIDGSFLVRPYKEQSTEVKYIATVYAHNQCFHLFIRQIDGKYAIGQPKSNEMQFEKPADIINYFRLNQLLCTNQQTCVKVFLVPIA